MTDKERLEEIKEEFYADEELHQFQIEWLIEQAEKFVELQRRVRELNIEIGQYANRVWNIAEKQQEAFYESKRLINDMVKAD